jgi:hypothetical protein
MITLEESIPSKNTNYRFAEDIFYIQFNDVEFYIEDTEQENLYFQILKKLFDGIKFEKIFPLDGKDNVIEECELNLNNKNKIFIVDKDFDEILINQKNYQNLFYLNSYSIENNLLSKFSIFEIIKEKKPKLKDASIEQIFDYGLLSKNFSCLKELAIIFIIIRKFELGESFFCINTNRDFKIETDFSYKSNCILDYKTLVETKLKLKDKRLSMNAQIKKHTKYFRTVETTVFRKVSLI